MSKGVNKVILVGNLGSGPELKKTSNEIPVITLSIATNKIWQDSDGNKQTRTEWHRVVLWRKLAELAGEYLKRAAKFMLRAGCKQGPGKMTMISSISSPR